MPGPLKKAKVDNQSSLTEATRACTLDCQSVYQELLKAFSYEKASISFILKAFEGHKSTMRWSHG